MNLREIGEYEVIGRREYRGHQPGEVFEAHIPVAPANRAIARGDIRLLRVVVPTIQSGNLVLSDGWTKQGR